MQMYKYATNLTNVATWFGYRIFSNFLGTLYFCDRRVSDIGLPFFLLFSELNAQVADLLHTS